MEILSSTDWAYECSGENFSANHYEDIGSYIDLKIKALECYRNVMRSEPHPRSEHVLKGLASYRGSQAGFQFAEAFQMIFKKSF